jgi:CRP-like cAMP-binding protein
MYSDVSETIQNFFSQFPQRTFPKGHILLFAGQDPEHLFYLESGKVRKYGMSYRGDEMIVNVYKPPAFFPMSWAINHTPNRYYYKTEEQTTARLAPVAQTMDFLRQNPDVMLNLLSRIYTGFEGMLGRIMHLMAASAKSRILYELIIECRRFGKQRDGGCWVSLHETDLAARSGLSRETVSREMRRFKADGLLEINRSGILVRDLEAVEKIIGGVI